MINLNNMEAKKNNISILLVLALFMSQFYFWSSGLPQFSHIFILLALLIFFCKNNKIKVSNVKIIFIFLAYVILVNLTWFMISGFETSYLVSIGYWIFNFSLFLLLVNLKDENAGYFLKVILRLIFFSYILEIFLWAVGLGKYSFSPRYNGFFNDPNQMAFWVLSTCSVYLYLSNRKINNIIIYFLALFLIMLTLSRSAILGFSLLTFAIIFKQKGDIFKKILLSLFSLLLVLLLLVVLNRYGVFDSILARIMQGLLEKDEQAEGRGFDILLNFPEYLLFGAGQGNYSLYSPAGNEIHSTWFGIFFYYGVFGLSIFLIFIYNIFRTLSFAEKILFLSPMLYGFTTYSARTTVFWFFIGVFVIAKKNSHMMEK